MFLCYAPSVMLFWILSSSSFMSSVEVKGSLTGRREERGGKKGWEGGTRDEGEKRPNEAQ